MVYTRRHPALLVMGATMLAIGFAFSTQSVTAGFVEYLSIQKLVGELTTLPWIFGAIAVVFGAWAMFGSHRTGDFDYYTGTLAGTAFILLIAMFVRWFLDPWVAVLSKAMGPVWGSKYLHDVLGLNYIVLGIIAGMLVVNVLKIPAWAEHGVRVSRLGLKTGVVLLGTLYSFAELQELGKLSVVMIGIFVLGSVGLVLWFSPRLKLPNSMGGVLSAGVGVCGVSAAVASAPVVKATSTEIAYTIGTILLWGVGCMFLFPMVGQILGLGYVQFGAWAGTGILNSAQVAGAALAFQPNGIETLKVAEIFNITRVLFLPIIVLWLAVWYVKREEGAQQVNIGQVVVTKFPVFVLGFLVMFLLSSTGVFAPAKHYQGKYFDSNIKAEKLLKDKDVVVLQAELGKIQRADQKTALGALITNRKVMAEDDVFTLEGIGKAKLLSKDADKILKTATGAVMHTSKKIAMFRDFIVWLFAFGLTGLGMQITLSSIRQAGGQPLVIGGIVGTAKAVLSLLVVMLFVSESV